MNRRPPSLRRRPGRLGTVALAGWVFADLLLVLALVSMSDRPDPLVMTPSPGPSESASPEPSSSPSPTGPRSVEKAPVKFSVSGEAKKGLVEQVRKATGQWEDRQAALVLTFGGSSGGTQYADHVNGLLDEARPGMFTDDTASENFHDLSERATTAELWVYFYTSPR